MGEDGRVWMRWQGVDEDGWDGDDWTLVKAAKPWRVWFGREGVSLGRDGCVGGEVSDTSTLQTIGSPLLHGL